MADNLDKKKKIIPKPPQRPNYQIWIILILLALIFGVTYFNKSTTAVDITPKRFEEMMLSNDVSKVVFVKNHEVVEVTLKEEALKNNKYKKLLEESNRFTANEGPHFQFKVVNAEIFDKKYNELQAKLPADQRFDYAAEERSDFLTTFFLNWVAWQNGPSLY